MTRKPFQRSGGSDHFIAIGRITWGFRRLTAPSKTWGSSFLNMPGMQNVPRFNIEKAPRDPNEFSVPYPTGFHQATKNALSRWQSYTRGHNRSSLFTFIGAARNWVCRDFRAVLLGYAQSEPGYCRLVDCDAAQCSTNSTSVLEALLGSEFCLQPKGDSHTRRSIFGSVEKISGIRVFAWEN